MSEVETNGCVMSISTTKADWECNQQCTRNQQRRRESNSATSDDCVSRAAAAKWTDDHIRAWRVSGSESESVPVCVNEGWWLYGPSLKSTGQLHWMDPSILFGQYAVGCIALKVKMCIHLEHLSCRNTTQI